MPFDMELLNRMILQQARREWKQMTSETVMERMLRAKRTPDQEPSELERMLKAHREYAEKRLAEVEAKIAELKDDDVAQD